MNIIIKTTEMMARMTNKITLVKDMKLNLVKKKKKKKRLKG